MAADTIKKFLGVKMTKFDWQATEGAPKNYPMTIIGGSLSYHDKSGSLYVPDRATLYNGWGNGRSSHIVGPDRKPLPNFLTINFFSYTENQFYAGRFDLPYATILKMFQDGYYDSTGDRTTYSALVVGVAPGGAVAVWAKGISKTTEVFFGQAEKVEKDWGSLTSATHITREEYVQKVLQSVLSPTLPDGTKDKDSPKTREALEALRKNGIPFGLWSTYRTHYPWQPLFTGIQVELIQHVQYFNGEQDYLAYPLDKTLAASTRAIPSELHFVGAPPGATGKPKSVKLFFNEAEILAAFQKLGSNNQPLQLEMRLDPERVSFFGPGKFFGVVDGTNGFSIWLRNDKESIELKRTEIKMYNT